MIIYKITNTITGKCYIGYTKNSIEKRWEQHYKSALSENKNRKFYNAIRKHGIECWLLEVIETLNDADANVAKQKEIFFISYYDSYLNGYNSTLGGDGNNGIVMSEESNEARSKKLKGVKKSPETIEKFKNRVQSAETRKRISESHKGKKKPWVKWTTEQVKSRSFKRRTISKDQYDRIYYLKAQGGTISEIASEVNLSRDMVKKWLKMDW